MGTRYLFVIILATAVAHTANAARQDASAALTPQEALRLMRAVNTSEAQIKNGSGAYASLTDVMTHRSFSPAIAASLTRVTEDDASVKSYRLVVLRHANGQAYQATLTPASGGGQAWLTDERGIIFVAQPLQ